MCNMVGLSEGVPRALSKELSEMDAWLTQGVQDIKDMISTYDKLPVSPTDGWSGSSFCLIHPYTYTTLYDYLHVCSVGPACVHTYYYII